ncbi:DUF4880 domain-containing protein [Pseudomonas sp. Fl5BN2]|uniref:FecR domain-containing protein n=1 Tax=Pseudomonas sp. Fl5BN2 TaxID=2697652 RepID=UPI0013775799|nr:FecR domain-containing protein [Pseudomonas sp. Fl5BN2]NBF04301.1 DUF4880 domain-containing protein [Pseudomonas sp. Fl5BN2]
MPIGQPTDRAAEPGEIATEVVEQAVLWMARLWADDASAEDQAACLHWRGEHPHHELAWNRLKAFEEKFSSVPAEVARHTLREPASGAYLNRRRTLQLLSLMFSAGGLAYVMRGTDAWQMTMAAHSSGTGEIRQVTLPDGTQVVLASASAIDVQFDELQRLVLLRAGEILVTTAPDPASSPRPFRVQGRDGKVRALGTRFSLRQSDDSSQVAVFEGAVEVQPDYAAGALLRVDAGHGATFSKGAVQASGAVTESSAAWVRGVLVADSMRLDQLLAELGRYRSGVLRCADEVAMLQVSGVFSLLDTDRALHNLTLALPVEVIRRTRYWVTVRAAV